MQSYDEEDNPTDLLNLTSICEGLLPVPLSTDIASQEDWSWVQAHNNSANANLALRNEQAQFLGPGHTAHPYRGAKQDRDLDGITTLVEQAELQARQLSILREIASSFLRRYARFAPLREETLLLRSRTKFQWQTCLDYRRFVSESQQIFLEGAASASTAALPLGGSPEKFRALHNQVLRDHEAQDEFAQQTHKLETELTDLEFKMLQREGLLAMAAGKMVAFLNQLSLPGQSGSVTAVESAAASLSGAASSAEMPPLLQHYFDKAGNVAVLRERLIDMELDHNEARAFRLFQAEHDQPLERSDQEFEATYLNKYAAKRRELDEAHHIAETAKAVYLDEGLDPESYGGHIFPEPDQNQEPSPRPDMSPVPVTPSSLRLGITPDALSLEQRLRLTYRAIGCSS